VLHAMQLQHAYHRFGAGNLRHFRYSFGQSASLKYASAQETTTRNCLLICIQKDTLC
jgi:hypothetical protein